MKLSLGPVLYYWNKEKVESFYRDIADSTVNRVYLGETICSKRNELRFEDWMGIARELRQAGKDIRLSTLGLIEAPQELEMLKPYLDNGEFEVEANDVAVIQMAKERNLPFVAGPAINVYNLSALKRLLKSGMTGWVMPVELSRDWLAALLDEAKSEGIREQFDVEVFGYGHLPLAYSARCFTARSLDRPKDQCKKCCIDFPDGRLVKNLEDKRMFVLNGIQTQSGDCYNLLPNMESMEGIVDLFRISPQHEGTSDIIEMAADLDSAKKSWGSNQCNGYWWAISGKDSVAT